MAEKIDLGIGQRVAHYRKLAGFRASEDLANAIPNPKVTASVIRNIESGRLGNISVAQLLDISRALDLSPIFLLVSIEKPFSKVDLLNVGPAVASMRSFEVDRWISGLAPSETVPSEGLRGVLLRMRFLVEEVPRYRRLMLLNKEHLARRADADEATPPPNVDLDETWIADLIYATTSPLVSAVRFLLNEGIDISWAQDVIEDLNMNREATTPKEVVNDASE